MPTKAALPLHGRQQFNALVRQAYLQPVDTVPAGHAFAVVNVGEVRGGSEIACLCGQCGATLAAVASVERLAGILLACPICKSFNRTAT